MKLALQLLGLCCAATLLASVEADESDSEKDLQAQARGIAAEFVSQLKPTLQAAMSEGGPVQAIAVCSRAAPAIASELSRESGWTVKRVSLKPRNYANAHPDAWEAEQLRDFDRRQAQGAQAADLNTAAVVDGQFRYLQAQAVEPVCLNCHGENIAHTVQDALRDFYPENMATGYRLGQVRGALSLVKNLDSANAGN